MTDILTVEKDMMLKELMAEFPRKQSIFDGELLTCTHLPEMRIFEQVTFTIFDILA